MKGGKGKAELVWFGEVRYMLLGWKRGRVLLKGRRETRIGRNIVWDWGEWDGEGRERAGGLIYEHSTNNFLVMDGVLMNSVW